MTDPFQSLFDLWASTTDELLVQPANTQLTETVRALVSQDDTAPAAIIRHMTTYPALTAMYLEQGPDDIPQVQFIAHVFTYQGRSFGLKGTSLQPTATPLDNTFFGDLIATAPRTPDVEALLTNNDPGAKPDDPDDHIECSVRQATILIPALMSALQRLPLRDVDSVSAALV